jgi:hypothetical protein
MHAGAQITTCRGIVMGRLRSEQRQLEVELMRFCHNKLGARALHALPFLRIPLSQYWLWAWRMRCPSQ